MSYYAAGVILGMNNVVEQKAEINFLCAAERVVPVMLLTWSSNTTSCGG